MMLEAAVGGMPQPASFSSISFAHLSAVEQRAREYGVSEITAEVSLTARPFFEKRGYEVMKIQKRRANRLKLTNFVMCKRLKD